MSNYLIDAILSPIQNVCVIIVVANIISQKKWYRDILEGKMTFKNKVLLTATFGLFSLYAALAGGIVNVRVLGPMLAGIMGGPAAGAGAALLGCTYRLFDLKGGLFSGQFTYSALLATLLAGISGGYLHRRKRGGLPKVYEAAAFASAFEVFHMALTVILGQSQEAVVIVRRYALPMIAAHAIGAATFIFVTQNIISACKNQVEKELAQQELGKSEERFATAFNFSPNPMTIRSVGEGEFVAVNDSFLRVFGYDREEVIGKKLQSIDIIQYDYYQTVYSLQKGRRVENLETQGYTKQGKKITGLLFCELIAVGNKPYVLDVFVDISQRKNLEEEVLRLERLNLVGQMATGIAHEIRNPLTTLRGFLQFLQTRKDLGKYVEYFDLSIEELDKISQLTSELIVLARNKSTEFKWTNLNQIICAMLPLIKAEGMLTNKTVETKLEELPELFIDEHEIKQMVLNLAKNGLEAMEENGKLSIATCVEHNEVVLSVCDQGKGIDDEVMKKLGTPFFTTKDTATGLGLAICYSIAERHDAAIKIQTGSEGTVFSVRFLVERRHKAKEMAMV
jgi:PAS domain S-box-containing protein